MMDCDAGELQRKLEVLNAVMASEATPSGCGEGAGAGRPPPQLQMICTPSRDAHSYGLLSYPCSLPPWLAPAARVWPASPSFQCVCLSACFPQLSVCFSVGLSHTSLSGLSVFHS